MGLWTDYTKKDTPEDNDTLMLYDAAGKANKQILFSGFWKWVANKLKEATLSDLQTTDKTMIGAINELNSNKIYRETISGTNTLEDYYVSNGKLPGAYKVTGVIVPDISKSVSWYGILLLLPVYDIQIVIVGGGRIFVRDKTGSPAVWQVWKQYTCTDIVKS